jgi:hypothetical protein
VEQPREERRRLGANEATAARGRRRLHQAGGGAVRLLRHLRVPKASLISRPGVSANRVEQTAKEKLRIGR